MPYRNRRAKQYKKTRSFSRRRPRRDWGRNADVKITVGTRRVWLWNNTDEEIIVRPGEYIELEIVREWEDRMGWVLRCNLRRFREAGVEEEEEAEVQEEPEDRVEDWI